MLPSPTAHSAWRPWLTAWTWICAPAAGIAVLAWGVGVTLTYLAALFFLAAVVYIAVLASRGSRVGRADLASASVARWGLWGCFTVLALTTFGSLWGFLPALLSLGILLTCPPARSYLRGVQMRARLRRGPRSGRFSFPSPNPHRGGR